MNSNDNSSLSTTTDWDSYYCSTLYLDAINIAGLFQKISSLIILIFFSFEIILLPLSLIGFLSIRKWHNPAKIYYYVISISNIMGCVFEDFSFGFFNSISFLSGWFPKIFIQNFVMKFVSISVITCPLIFFLADISILIAYWAVTLFSIHRMFAVLFPLKANKLHNYFNKWTMVILFSILSSLYLPDFFFYQILQITSKLSVCIYRFQGFWYSYLTSLTYIKYIIPLFINTLAISLIILKLARSRINRHHLITQNNLRMNTSENRTTTILIISGIVYIFVTLPYSICFILDGINQSVCPAPFFEFYIVLSHLIGVLIHYQLIIRVFDPIIYFVMIPEFRKAIINICCLHKRFFTNATNQKSK